MLCLVLMTETETSSNPFHLGKMTAPVVENRGGGVSFTITTLFY